MEETVKTGQVAEARVARTTALSEWKAIFEIPACPAEVSHRRQARFGHVPVAGESTEHDNY